MKYDIENIIKRYDDGDALDYVFFWGHHAKPGMVTKACLSQWFPSYFAIDGIVYNCAEQYMMAEKARYFNDEETRSKILVATDPKVIKSLGREVRDFSVSRWKAVSKDIVVKGNLHKFSQNSELQRFLLDTEDRVLVEASPYDTIWGIGMKESDEGITNPHTWRGFNQLGFALLEVREMLMSQ